MTAALMTPAASWYLDPLRRHQLRYWDGARWTDHAADRGQACADPLPAALADILARGLPKPTAVQADLPSIVCSTLARQLLRRRGQFASATYDEAALRPFLLAGTDGFPDDPAAPMGIAVDAATRDLELARASLGVSAAIAFIGLFIPPHWPHPSLVAFLDSLPPLVDASAVGRASARMEEFRLEDGKIRSAWRQGNMVWRDGRGYFGGQALGFPVPAAGSSAWPRDVALDQALGGLGLALAELHRAHTAHPHPHEAEMPEWYDSNPETADFFLNIPSGDIGDLDATGDSIRHACLAIQSVDGVAAQVISPPTPEFPILLALLHGISSFSYDALTSRLIASMPPPAAGPQLRRCGRCGAVTPGHLWDRCTNCRVLLGASTAIDD